MRSRAILWGTGAIVVGLCCKGREPRVPSELPVLASRVQSLRLEARFEEALDVAARLDSLLRFSRPARWQVEDAQREIESLRKLTALPEPERDRWRQVARTPSGEFSDDEANSAAVLSSLQSFADLCARWLGPESGEHAAVLAELAVYHQQRNELFLAHDLDERALRIREHALGPRHPEVAASLDRLALDTKMISGARPPAMELCERALAMRRELLGEDSRDTAISLLRRANFRRTRQEMPAALADFERAEAIFARTDGEASRKVAEVLTDRGLTLGTQERWADAEPVLRRAVAMLRSLGQPPNELWALALVQHGIALRELGRGEEAETVLREAAAVQELRWRAARPDRNRANRLVLTAYRELSLLAVESGRWTEAWENLERFSSRSAVDAAVARGTVRGGPELWDALLPRVQRALPDSTAMVGWVDSRYGGRLPDWPFWCFVVRKTGEPAWFRVEAPVKNQEPLLFEVRRFIGAMHAEADWPLRLESSPELERLGRAMYRLRFAPLEPALSGIRNLVFASPDMNYCSPVEAMIDDQGRYIADRFVTLYSPSALLYAIAREQQSRPIDRRHWKALLVGSPAGKHPSLWDSLPPLRNAEHEIRSIAVRLPNADVLLGEAAAESGLASLRDSGQLAAYDVIHFATHAYLASPPREERSALLLAEAQPLEPNLTMAGPPARVDGWLTAAEITSTWRLNAQLVSLAACRGSSVGYAMANGPTGIGAAFLDAGAHCVLMSPYAIDDEASGLFFKEYAALMFSNEGPPIESAVAVRAARSKLRAHRAPDGTSPYRSPAFWAAFVLVGGPD